MLVGVQGFRLPRRLGWPLPLKRTSLSWQGNLRVNLPYLSFDAGLFVWMAIVDNKLE